MRRPSHPDTDHWEEGPKERMPRAKSQGRSILGKFKEQKEKQDRWSEVDERSEKSRWGLVM